MVVKVVGQLMKKNLCRSALFEKVVTLFGVVQNNDLHG
jgi:hypothetical protein